MLLTTQDADLFFRLHRTPTFFVNQRLKVLPDDLFAVHRGRPRRSPGWRTLDADSVKDEALHRIIGKADVVSPWAVGRYRTLDGVADHVAPLATATVEVTEHVVAQVDAERAAPPISTVDRAGATPLGNPAAPAAQALDSPN